MMAMEVADEVIGGGGGAGGGYYSKGLMGSEYTRQHPFHISLIKIVVID